MGCGPSGGKRFAQGLKWSSPALHAGGRWSRRSAIDRRIPTCRQFAGNSNRSSLSKCRNADSQSHPSRPLVLTHRSKLICINPLGDGRLSPVVLFLHERWSNAIVMFVHITDTMQWEPRCFAAWGAIRAAGVTRTLLSFLNGLFT